MHPDKVILELVRLGAKGDASSVRRFAKRLIRDLDLGPSLRDSLAEFVAETPDAPLRWAAATEVKSPQPEFLVQEDVEEFDGWHPILPTAVRADIEQLVAERKRASELEAVGLVPTRSLLLTGRPGVGKTLTAKYLAGRLELPVFRADLSSLMSSFLGKTGHNLRDALAFAKGVPSVLLLDEFDAIAKRRDDPTDVGELKRIVNVLLLELERWPSTGLLVAATNHPELLDRAIWRRFERVISIGLPDEAVRRELIARLLKRHGQSISHEYLSLAAVVTEGASAADVDSLVRRTLRRLVLGEGSDLGTLILRDGLDLLENRARADTGARALFCTVAHEQLRMPQREIAERLGCAHVTVGRILKATVKAAGKQARGVMREQRNR